MDNFTARDDNQQSDDYVFNTPGGLCGGTKMVHGGWAWAWWCLSDVQSMPLQVMTLNPVCEHVETAAGVPLTVTGVAQVKVMTDAKLLPVAVEQFLGKDQEYIKTVLLQTVEGHLRAILGTLSVEAIYQDRDEFAETVRQVAAPDLGRMGMEILSFTIKDVVDTVDYLNSLGRTRVAMVHRDADIGVAEANRDAGIIEANCEKEAMDVKYQVDSKLANEKRELDMQLASFAMEVNKAKADAELAYQLQAAKMQQKIRQEEIAIDIVERRKQIDIEECEIQRMEKELAGTVKLPAEADAYRVQAVAEGERSKLIAESRADAERLRLLGTADATAIQARGQAEAEAMRLRAASYRQYGNAAITSLVLDSLPKIAAEVAAPLRKTHEMVLVGGDSHITNEVAKLAATLPPSVQALTGVDLHKIVQKVTATT